MKRFSTNRIIALSISAVWLSSWAFAGELVAAFRGWGVFLPRGLVVSSGLSDLLFSLMVLSFMLVLWALAALAARPFIAAREWRARDAELARMAELKERKAQLLNAMRELEFDAATGKVEVSDKAALGDKIRAEAAEVYAEIDRLDPVARFREQIERDVEALRRG